MYESLHMSTNPDKWEEDQYSVVLSTPKNIVIIVLKNFSLQRSSSLWVYYPYNYKPRDESFECIVQCFTNN